MISDIANDGVRGDRALQAGDEDRLGFREMASRIADSLIDHASDSGLVMGIDGSWGSGKSSLLFLIEDELSKLEPKRRPTVINFRPWLVGNRDALLANFFGMLSQEINRVQADAGDATGISIEKAKAAAAALRGFAEGLGLVGSVVEFTGEASGFAPLKWMGKGVSAFSRFAKGKSNPRPLPELKAKLVKSLAELGHRFVVTIDDVDRLEPAEVIEVLRLARSVADFPNVVYLLCYDSHILSHSIKTAAKVQDGHAYLEKIVQLTLMVPAPETFQLRQWFTDDLRKIAFPRDEDGLVRLKTVIDHEGGRLLRTPRSVVRGLDALRFFWPPLRNLGADLADLVWLQLIKDAYPKLYRWIEDYSAVSAVLSLGTATIGEGQAAKYLAELVAAVDEGFFVDRIYRHHFAEHLPGIESSLDDGATFALFGRVTEAERGMAIRDKRLASPDHYRLYFALAGPSHAVTNVLADEIAEAAEASADKIGRVLLELHNQPIGAGPLGRADILLERYKLANDTLSPAQCQNLLLAFSNMLDDAFRARSFDIGWMNTLWDRAESLTPIFLARLDDNQRAATLKAMFGDGRALGWLSGLLRHETFSHGRFGDRRKPEQEWYFTEVELDEITSILLNRYRAMSRPDLFALVRPLDVLFAWSQGGDPDGPRKLVGDCIGSDEELVQTLEILATMISSSDRGTFSVLKRTNLGPFLDFDEAKARISALAQIDGPLRERAKKLYDAFNDAERF